MSPPKSIIEIGHELIPQLEQQLKEIAALIRASKDHVRIDALYRIPFRNKAEVNCDDPIEIMTLEGDDAIAMAAEVLTAIQFGAGQSARETLRAPGAIGLPSLILEKIRSTNLLRVELFRALEGTPLMLRRRLWRIHKGSGTQTLRVTPILEDPLHIRFYWDTGSVFKRWLVSDLIKQCEDQLMETFGHRPSVSEVVEQSLEIKTLLSLEQLERLNSPDEQVAVRRPGTPHIRARVIDGDIQPYICSAAVPFVYDIACPRPEIKALVNYCPVEAEKERPKRTLLEDTPCVEHMKVYQYLPAHRKYGPFESRSSGRNVRVISE